MISNFSEYAFNGSVTSNVVFWNQDLIVALLTIIAFCQLINTLNTFKRWVTK